MMARGIIYEHMQSFKTQFDHRGERQCHIHHAKIVHGSNPNTSTQRRCGYTMRYMPTWVEVLGDHPQLKHAVYLARGEDRAGNEYGDPTMQYVPGIR